MLFLELLALYLCYEILIGIPAAMYFYFKKWDISESGTPRMLRYFPIGSWFFRTAAGKESMVDALNLRVTATPNLIIFMVCGILGLSVVVLVGAWAGSEKEWAEKDIIMAFFGFLVDIFLFLLTIVVFLVYCLAMLLLYNLLISGPAQRKQTETLQNELWEAKRQARMAKTLLDKNNQDPQPPAA